MDLFNWSPEVSLDKAAKFALSMGVGFREAGQTTLELHYTIFEYPSYEQLMHRAVLLQEAQPAPADERTSCLCLHSREAIDSFCSEDKRLREFRGSPVMYVDKVNYFADRRILATDLINGESSLQMRDLRLGIDDMVFAELRRRKLRLLLD